MMKSAGNCETYAGGTTTGIGCSSCCVCCCCGAIESGGGETAFGGFRLLVIGLVGGGGDIGPGRLRLAYCGERDC